MLSAPTGKGFVARNTQMGDRSPYGNLTARNMSRGGFVTHPAGTEILIVISCGGLALDVKPSTVPRHKSQARRQEENGQEIAASLFEQAPKADSVDLHLGTQFEEQGEEADFADCAYFDKG